MVVEGRFGDNDATIGGTTGAVVRSGRLTLVVGDVTESFDADSQLPIEALKTADRLTAEGSWEFDEVASALHQLVIDHDPAGVAAFLDGEVEAMVFLFDQAEAVEFDPDGSKLAEETIEANGRTGWTTELVSGPLIRLRLRGSGDSLGWTSLRDGLVPGDTAVVTVAAYDEVYAHNADQPVNDDAPTDGDPAVEVDGGANVEADVEDSAEAVAENVAEEQTPEDAEEITAATADENHLDDDNVADSADASAETDVADEQDHAETTETDGDDAAQQTMVVDPSQIGLTRLGTEGQPAEAQPPPPGGSSPLPATGPNAAPSPHQPPAPAPPSGSPPPPNTLLPPPIDTPPPAAATPLPAPPADLLPPSATPSSTSPIDAPPPAGPPSATPSFAAPVADPPNGPPPANPAPTASPPPAAPISAPPPSSPGPDVSVPAPPGPSGPPVNLPPPPRGPGGMPRPPVTDGSADGEAEAWTPAPPPPGVPAPPPSSPSPQAFVPPAPSSGPGPGPGPGQPPPPGQLSAPAPPAPSAWPAPPAPGGPPAAGPAPFGFLTDKSNGRQHVISGPTVIGSDPSEDAEVVIGAATMITVEDPSVHEVHVRIKVSGHSVSVEDAGFGNAWLQNDGGPMELLDAAPRPLNPGSQLRLGSRTFVFKPAVGPGS